MDGSLNKTMLKMSKNVHFCGLKFVKQLTFDNVWLYFTWVHVVLQVQTFSAESLGYKDFFDGLVLNNCIMKQM